MVKMQISGCYNYVIFYVSDEENNEINVMIYEFNNATDMRQDDCSDEQKLQKVRNSKVVDPHYIIVYDCNNSELSLYDYNHDQGNIVLKNREHVRHFSNMIEDCYEYIEDCIIDV